jgi:hypothetical protein
VGTRATDAALRGVIAVDKTLGVSSGAAAIDEKLGVSEKATSAASSLDERFAITQKYADALSKVGGIRLWRQELLACVDGGCKLNSCNSWMSDLRLG